MPFTPQHRDRLAAGLRELGLPDDPERLDLLGAYWDLLRDGNATMNLTAIRNEDDAVTRHFLDSVAPWHFFEGLDPIADLGSGGGVPGIPLAICLPHRPRVTLLESTEKKYRFLRRTIASLGLLEQVGAERGDANVGKTQFAAIASRAFGGLVKSARVAAKRLTPGGKLIAYKGRRDTIDAEIADLQATAQGARFHAEVHPLTVPGLEAEQRHVVILT